MFGVTHSHSPLQAQILLEHVAACVFVCVRDTVRLLNALIKYELQCKHSLFLGANERCCATVCEMIKGPDNDY